MNTRSLILALTSGVLLTASSGMALANSQKNSTPAAAKQAAPKARGKATTSSVSRGTITSIDANRLVISHKKNGKPEDLTFSLSPETSRKGDLAVGNPVTVHYRTQNNEHMATSLQAMPQKAQSHTKAKPKKG